MSLSEEQRSLEAQLTMWVINENRKRGAAVSLDELQEKAAQLSAILTPGLDELSIEQVRVVVTQKGNVSQDTDFGIRDKTFKSWIADRKPHTDEKRWNAYRGLLVSRGWAPRVIEALEQQTADVVELMGDPLVNTPWARRGLLMGEVQSGKTATYIGVLNKAIDYGYRVIIILGGHTNDLRNQTQARVDLDLTGTNSSFLEDNIRGAGEQMRVGIGLVDQSFSTIGMTTVRRDFSASSRLASTVWVDTGVPTVFVIKKNVRMLENVASYIRAQAGQNGFSLPLVIVDDEADWGSPNTADPESDPTRVNRAIRSLLDVSSRSTYVGITATPFANVLIDHTVEDDLFPSDYIRALASPSNYQGVGSYFHEGNDVVNTDVQDCLDQLPLKHKKDQPFGELPASMEDAIIAFFVGTAIRRLRDGVPKPASMMINVSRFNRVQALVSRSVESFVARVASVVSTELSRTATDSRSVIALHLRAIAERLYCEPSTEEYSWVEISRSLIEVASSIRVDLVNNVTSKDRANARRLLTPDQRLAVDTLPVIYVGGDVLSRGLTLDGLQVSYFVRRPGSADTLLQMGRWFGYRPGYDDLVRIWMPEKLVEIFGNVARISQELREDLREMQAHGLTPKQFGLKIRLIPEIAIVAANKRRAAVVEDVLVNLHGQVKQSVNLSLDSMARNAEAVDRFISRVAQSGSPYSPKAQAFGWREVALTEVVRFFDEFTAHQSDLFFGTGPNVPKPQIARFLSDAKNANSWDVVIVNGSGAPVTLPSGSDRKDLGGGEQISFRSSLRNQLQLDRPVVGSLHFKNQQVASATDLANSFTVAAYNELRASIGGAADLDEARSKGSVTNPMLMIYAVTTREASDSSRPEILIRPDMPLWAVRVVFPPLDLDVPGDLARQGRGVRILVNTVWQEEVFGIDLEPDTFDEEVDG
jgi:hypothetical protein